MQQLRRTARRVVAVVDIERSGFNCRGVRVSETDMMRSNCRRESSVIDRITQSCSFRKRRGESLLTEVLVL